MKTQNHSDPADEWILLMIAVVSVVLLAIKYFES